MQNGSEDAEETRLKAGTVNALVRVKSSEPAKGSSSTEPKSSETSKPTGSYRVRGIYSRRKPTKKSYLEHGAEEKILPRSSF